MNLSGNEIRARFLEFFKKREHVIVPSASLVPENDPTVLFNTAGMQPLVPYLMGQPHPTGAKRIADVQKCLRTNDIDEVGDNTHLTFFEMLGNWSLGDYFKKEAIQWSFEFLTSKDEGLGLDPKRLYVTVFEGDANAPRDEEAYQIWKEIFLVHDMDPEQRIFFMDAEANWWSPGDNGPCGPDSEMFYDVTGTLTEGLTREEFLSADERQDVVEIWNDVFMEYEKKDGVVIGKLASQNVDTGSGLERITAMVQGVDNVFATDLFQPILQQIDVLATEKNGQASRIIADHLRATTFLMADGVSVSNTDQGYILRRLLRRSIRQADILGMSEYSLSKVAQVVIDHYHEACPQLKVKESIILDSITKEEEQFRKTLANGLKKIEKMMVANGSDHTKEILITAEQLFDLYQTDGFPLELSLEIINSKKVAPISKDVTEHFKKLFEEHKAKSRASAEHKFKGGLADHSEIVVHYHTATHLMLAGLRQELGEHVHQAGSNITAERLRFDITHPEKISREVLDKVEEYVNNAIKSGGVVSKETIAKLEAEADKTIEGSFWDKYPDMVHVYTMTTADGTVVSRELCGGPHVERLEDIKGTFKITKEESSSAGVRRIKAIIE